MDAPWWSSESFRCFHEGVWKTGFYDPVSKVLVGSVNGEVTTVFGNATAKYISNLKAAHP